jgi:hypothetical protein
MLAVIVNCLIVAISAHEVSDYEKIRALFAGSQGHGLDVHWPRRC